MKRPTLFRFILRLSVGVESLFRIPCCASDNTYIKILSIPDLLNTARSDNLDMVDKSF